MQKTTATFTFKNVDQIKSECSKPFSFRDILWRIQIQRNANYFRVFLHCVKDDNASNWLINASIAFRLLPYSFGRYPPPARYERSLGAFKFCSKRLNCGISNFITIDELKDPAKQLMQNNCINFEVEINASHDEIVATKRPPDELELPMEIEEKRFSFEITNVSEITAMIFAPVYIADIPWQLVVSKYKTGENESLGCHLTIDQQKFEVNEKFTCDVAVEYELQSQKSDVEHNASSEFYTLNVMNAYSMPLKHLATLSAIFDDDNGFLVNDGIQLDANFKLKLPTEYFQKKAKRMKISCPICFDDMVGGGGMQTTECGHLFCNNCIANTIKTLKKCVICDKFVLSNKIHPIYLP